MGNQSDRTIQISSPFYFGIYPASNAFNTMKPFGVVSQHKQEPPKVAEVSVIHTEKIEAQPVVKMPKTQAFAYKQQAKIHVIDRSRNVVPKPSPVPPPQQPPEVIQPIHVVEKTRPAMIRPIRPIKPVQPINVPAQKNQPIHNMVEPLKPFQPEHVQLLEQNQQIQKSPRHSYNRLYQNLQEKKPAPQQLQLSQDGSALSMKQSAVYTRFYDPHRSINNLDVNRHQQVALSEDASDLFMKQSARYIRVYNAHQERDNGKQRPFEIKQVQKQQVQLSEDGSVVSWKQRAVYSRLMKPKENVNQVIVQKQQVALSEDGSVLSVRQHERYNRKYNPQPQKQDNMVRTRPKPLMLSYLLKSESYEKQHQPDISSKLSHRRQLKPNENKKDQAEPQPVPVPVPIPPPSYQQIEVVSFPKIQPIIIPPLSQTSQPKVSGELGRLQQIEVVNFQPLAPIII